jgi:thioredoxin
MKSRSTTSSAGKVTATTDNRFAFDVLRHDGPVLADFHAPWCRTCQLLEPVLDDLAPTWSDRLRIVSIDIERHPGAAARHHVQSIPTLVLFDHGIEQDRLVNVIRHERISDWLHHHIDQHTSDPSAGRTNGEPNVHQHP